MTTTKTTSLTLSKKLLRVLILLVVFQQSPLLYGQTTSKITAYRNGLKENLKGTMGDSLRERYSSRLIESYFPKELDSVKHYTYELMQWSTENNSDICKTAAYRLRAELSSAKRNYDKAFENAFIAKELAKKSGREDLEVGINSVILSNYILSGNSKKALEFGAEILKTLNGSEGSDSNKSSIYRGMMKASVVLDKREKAEEYFNKSISYAITPAEISDIYITYAKALFDKKDYQATLAKLLKANEIRDENPFSDIENKKYSQNIVRMFRISGDIRERMMEYEKALVLYDSAVAFSLKQHLYNETIRSLLNKSISLLRLNRKEDRLETLLEGYEIMNTHNKKKLEYRFLLGIGYSYLNLGDFERSIDYLKRTTELARSKKDTTRLANGYASMGEVYLKIGDVEAARKVFEESEKLYSKSTKLSMDAEEKQFYLLSMCIIDSTNKKYKKSLYHLTKYVALRDSIQLSNQRDKLSELRVEYETEKKEKEIALLKNANELQKIKAQKSRDQRLVFIIGIIVLTVSLYVFYRINKTKTKALEIIKNQKKDIELKNEENELLVQEIHHRVKNNLQIILSLLEMSSDKVRDVDNVQDILMESKNRIKSIAFIHRNLYKSNSYIHTSSSYYFDELINNIEKSYNNKNSRKVTIVKKIKNKQLPISVAVPLGLIVNELLTNTFKHAFNNSGKNNKIIIEFDKKEAKQAYHLKFSDNGIGKNILDVQNSKSFGIEMIKGLVTQLSGSINILSSKGLCYDITLRAVPDR